MFETELEYELEDELESEDEWELEGASEFEDELEGAGELEDELEMEDEWELGEGEEFLGKFLKKAVGKVGGFIKKAAPILKAIARKAAPLVGTAIGGPAGGLIAGGLSKVLLRESELEDELELEDESEFEDEFEDGVMTAGDAEAEYIAAKASRLPAKTAAPALVGAATVATLSGSDRAALRKVLPHMVHGTNVLTRILRQRALTRPAVRTVPTIVRRTAKILKKRAAMGKPVTRAAAGRIMAGQIQKVIGNHHKCAHAIARNIKASRAVARKRRMIRG